MISTTRNLALTLMGISVILVGGVFAVAQEMEPTTSGLATQAGIYGHVTAVLTDSDGNVKQYIQTDNAILQEAKGALIEDLFGVAAAGDPANDYTFVSLGTNATAHVEDDSAGAFTETSPLCPREDAGVSAGSSIATTKTAGQLELNIQVQFLGADANCAVTVDEAALFDASTAGNMFALTKLTSQVVLASGDTLTLDWDITFT